MAYIIIELICAQLRSRIAHAARIARRELSFSKQRHQLSSGVFVECPRRRGGSNRPCEQSSGFALIGIQIGWMYWAASGGQNDNVCAYAKAEPVDWASFLDVRVCVRWGIIRILHANCTSGMSFTCEKAQTTPRINHNRIDLDGFFTERSPNLPRNVHHSLRACVCNRWILQMSNIKLYFLYKCGDASDVSNYSSIM